MFTSESTRVSPGLDDYLVFPSYRLSIYCEGATVTVYCEFDCYEIIDAYFSIMNMAGGS